MSFTCSAKAVVATFLLPIALQITLTSQAHAEGQTATVSAPTVAPPTTGWQSPVAPLTTGWQSPVAPLTTGWQSPVAPLTTGWQTPNP